MLSEEKLKELRKLAERWFPHVNGKYEILSLLDHIEVLEKALEIACDTVLLFDPARSVYSNRVYFIAAARKELGK